MCVSVCEFAEASQVCVFTGDDPDEISSSGSEDNADIQSSDVEFKGMQPSLIFIVINHYAIMIINHYAINPFNGPFSGTTRVSRYQKGTSNANSNVVRICDNFPSVFSHRSKQVHIA